VFCTWEMCAFGTFTHVITCEARVITCETNVKFPCETFYHM